MKFIIFAVCVIAVVTADVSHLGSGYSYHRPAIPFDTYTAPAAMPREQFSCPTLAQSNAYLPPAPLSATAPVYSVPESTQHVQFDASPSLPSAPEPIYSAPPAPQSPVQYEQLAASIPSISNDYVPPTLAPAPRFSAPAEIYSSSVPAPTAEYSAPAPTPAPTYSAPNTASIQHQQLSVPTPNALNEYVPPAPAPAAVQAILQHEHLTAIIPTISNVPASAPASAPALASMFSAPASVVVQHERLAAPIPSFSNKYVTPLPLPAAAQEYLAPALPPVAAPTPAPTPAFAPLHSALVATQHEQLTATFPALPSVYALHVPAPASVSVYSAAAPVHQELSVPSNKYLPTAVSVSAPAASAFHSAPAPAHSANAHSHSEYESAAQTGGYHYNVPVKRFRFR